MRSIYIIDDDEELRISLHRLLSLRSDLLIRSFASGDAFLGQRDELDPGVLLLDMNMPGASGLDVLRAIKDQPRFLAIILTGQGNIEVATKAMKAGAFDFLEKPYDYQALTEVMEGAFDKLEQESAAAARVESARAHDLAISPRTVEIYRANLMAKLKVRSLSEALKIAFAAGMFPDE
jgi:two-component system, LuxR family, response regulator FixJ